MTPIKPEIPTDEALDAMLKATAGPFDLADDGFSQIVMAQVYNSPLPSLPAAQALAVARQRLAREQRQSRWSLGGAVVGSLIALGLMQLPGGDSLASWQGWGMTVLVLVGTSGLLAAVMLKGKWR